MLTPQEISEKAFVKAVFGGYDMTGVDDFLETITADYTALYKENAILKGKLKVLVEKVEEYRSTEDAMRMALLTAQRMGEEITIEANKAREEKLRSADKDIKAKYQETAKRVADEELRLSIAAKETSKFIELSQAIMQKHSEFLTKLETARRAVRPDPGSSQPTAPAYTQQVAVEAPQTGGVIESTNGDDTYATASGNAEASSPEPDYDDADDSMKIYGIDNDDDELVTPRPKFDFDDLKFGANFDKKK